MPSTIRQGLLAFTLLFAGTLANAQLPLGGGADRTATRYGMERNAFDRGAEASQGGSARSHRVFYMVLGGVVVFWLLGRLNGWDKPNN
jgi:hypothetical protein